MANRSSAKVSKDYKVGKGRPPIETQFKPGQSGCPQGRPKGVKGIATVFRNEMNKKVVVTENGKRRKITKAEAAIKQLINSAIKGNPKAIEAILRIFKELGDLKLPNSATQPLVRTRRFTLSIFDRDNTGKLNQEPCAISHFTGEHLKPGMFGYDSSEPPTLPQLSQDDRD